LILSLLGLTVQAHTMQKQAASQKPNIILFFVDDLGWADLGFRNPNLETPNIDKLTKDDSSLKRMAFPFFGFEDLILDGDGSTFMFHGRMSPLF